MLFRMVGLFEGDRIVKDSEAGFSGLRNFEGAVLCGRAGETSSKEEGSVMKNALRPGQSGLFPVRILPRDCGIL